MSTTDPASRLREERVRLIAALDSATGAVDRGDESGALSELSTYDQHPGDVATETFLREVDQSLAESVRAEIADVDAALRRVEDGTYGACLSCGRPIGDARLEALPAARFCIDDAARAEDEALRSGGPLAGPKAP